MWDTILEKFRFVITGMLPPIRITVLKVRVQGGLRRPLPTASAQLADAIQVPLLRPTGTALPPIKVGALLGVSPTLTHTRPLRRPLIAPPPRDTSRPLSPRRLRQPPEAAPLELEVRDVVVVDAVVSARDNRQAGPPHQRRPRHRARRAEMARVRAASLLARGVRAAMLPQPPRSVDTCRLVAITAPVMALMPPPRPTRAAGDAAPVPIPTPSVRPAPMS